MRLTTITALCNVLCHFQAVNLKTTLTLSRVIAVTLTCLCKAVTLAFIVLTIPLGNFRTVKITIRAVTLIFVNLEHRYLYPNCHFDTCSFDNYILTLR